MRWIENGEGQGIGVQWNEILRQNGNTPHGNGIVLNENDKPNTNTIKHDETKQNNTKHNDKTRDKEKQ